MHPTLKRVLLSFLLLAIAAIIGLTIYFLFFKKTFPAIFRRPTTGTATTSDALPQAGDRTPGAPGTPTGGAASGLPTASQIPVPGTTLNIPETVVQITDNFVNFPSANTANGTNRYYNGADGKFYRIQNNGAVTEMSSQQFYNVTNVAWANNKDIAVLEYPDQTKIIYDFSLNKQTFSPPKHWQEFSFSSDGRQIAAKSIGLAPENRWLVTVNTDGTGAKMIEPMGNNADLVQVNWSPSHQVVAFSMTGEVKGFDRREVLLVGLNHENFKSTIVEGMGFQPQWSPTGQKLLYSVYSTRSDWKPELWIVNSYGEQIGSNRRLLSLNTWADKCSFSTDDTLFCAVPRNLQEGAGVSPSIASGNIYDLYKIDLKTGLKINIPLDKDYHIKNVSYDKNSNKIYFTDNFQNGIFQVNL